MPIYTYLCQNCQAVFDIEKSMTERHPKKCPICGFVGDLGRRFNVPGITFHGSGFYHTDKVLSEITDPEYQLSHDDQIRYYDEKLKDGDDRKIRVFT
jgi:putative FmdB family regulatory protein